MFSLHQLRNDECVYKLTDEFVIMSFEKFKLFIRKKIIILGVIVHFAFIIWVGLPYKLNIESVKNGQYVPHAYWKLWSDVVDKANDTDSMFYLFSNVYTRTIMMNIKWNLFSFPLTHPEFQIYVSDKTRDMLIYSTYMQPGLINESNVELFEHDLNWRLIHGITNTYYRAHAKIANRRFYNLGHFYLNKLKDIDHKKKSEFYIQINKYCLKSPLLVFKSPCVEFQDKIQYKVGDY